MEYRFRGYDAVGSKGWVYGDLVHNMKVSETGLEPRVMVGGYEVIPESVGLGSGFFDINEKEIFVGDIIRIYDKDFDEYFDNEVIFELGSIGICAYFGNVTILSSFFHVFNNTKSESEGYKVQVIGNIIEKQK